MKIFGSTNIASGQVTSEVPAGQYKSIVINISGVADTAKTVALADLGRLTIRRGGDEICNIDLQDLYNINQADAGYPQHISNTAGAFNFQVRYEFSDINDAINTAKFNLGEGQVQVILGAVVGKAVSGTVDLYSVNAKGIEKYIVRRFDFSQNIGNANSVVTPILSNTNVTRVCFRTGSDFGQIQVTKDDLLLIQATGAALISDTSYVYKLEAGAATFILIDLNKTKAAAELVSNKIQFYLTSAVSATTTGIVYEQYYFDAAKTARSVSSYNNWQSQKLLAAPPVKAAVAAAQAAPKASAATA